MKLTRVFFAMPIQDPSAPGLFERKDFNKNSAKGVSIFREEDGSITLTAPSGAQVVVSSVPYWGNPEPPPPPPEPVERVGDLPPVTQSQAHPRDRVDPFYKGGRGPRK